MTAASIFDELEELTDAEWFCEPRDRDPASEFDRQRSFLAKIARIAPAIDVQHFGHEGKSSDWMRVRLWRAGLRKGSLDLVMAWKPTLPGDRGTFWAEFKSGTGMPSLAQRERLNRFYNMGFRCGVYRTAETLIDHLRKAGAPFL